MPQATGLLTHVVKALGYILAYRPRVEEDEVGQAGSEGWWVGVTGGGGGGAGTNQPMNKQEAGGAGGADQPMNNHEASFHTWGTGLE